MRPSYQLIVLMSRTILDRVNGMSDFQRKPIVPGGSDSSAFSLPKWDGWIGGRQVVRVTPRRSRVIYGELVHPLYAHRDGLPVLRRELAGLTGAEKVVGHAKLICGVLLCTRWGTVMVQWRGFPRGTA
jgi:hypothetical protein